MPFLEFFPNWIAAGNLLAEIDFFLVDHFKSPEMALFGATIQIIWSIVPRYKMHSQTLMDVFFRAFGTPGRPLVTNDFRVELPLGAIAIKCGSYLPVIVAALFLFLHCTIHTYYLLRNKDFDFGNRRKYKCFQWNNMTRCKINLYTYQSQNPPNLKVVLEWWKWS